MEFPFLFVQVPIFLWFDVLSLTMAAVPAAQIERPEGTVGLPSGFCRTKTVLPFPLKAVSRVGDSG